jgi:site-specific recombinase XerD
MGYTHRVPAPVAIQIDRFLLSMVETRSKQTIAWYAKRLAPLHPLDSELMSIHLDDLRQIYAQLAHRSVKYAHHPTRPDMAGHLSPSTLRGYVRAWRAFFNWLVDEGLIASSPARKLKLPRVPEQPPKAISRADMERIVEAARRSSARDYAIVCILADSACRVGGLCNITLDNLYLDRGYAIVVEKNSQARYLLFTDRTLEAIGRYLEERPAGDYRELFLGHTHHPLQTGGIHQLLARLATAAGVKGRHNPHAFRHGWARAALDGGADLSDVAHVLGHSNVQVTYEFYGRWTPEELRAIHARATWLPANGALSPPVSVETLPGP